MPCRVPPLHVVVVAQVEIDLFPDLRAQGRSAFLIKTVKAEESQVALAMEKAIEILKNNTLGLTRCALAACAACDRGYCLAATVDFASSFNPQQSLYSSLLNSSSRVAGTRSFMF